jgi:hypothetical protein
VFDTPHLHHIYSTSDFYTTPTLQLEARDHNYEHVEPSPVQQVASLINGKEHNAKTKSFSDPFLSPLACRSSGAVNKTDVEVCHLLTEPPLSVQ